MRISKQEADRRKALALQGIKVCSHCKQELPFECFSKDKTTKDGFCSTCKYCLQELRILRKDYYTQYLIKNKEKRQHQAHEYYLTHKENKKAYNEKHKEKFKIARKINDHKVTNRYKLYKRNAVTRNIPFNLSFEEFNTITQQPCYYCGELTKDEYDIIFTGVDRIDSTQGYFYENVVSCCNMCNKMKLNYTLEDWLNKIQQIAINMNLI